LVFGIRQGVEDLNFRLQETDVKVDLFLRTLASLQDSLTPRQNEDSPVQEPNAPQEEAADAKMGAGRVQIWAQLQAAKLITQWTTGKVTRIGPTRSLT
jgi:hypothetical protein